MMENFGNQFPDGNSPKEPLDPHLVEPQRYYESLNEQEKESLLAWREKTMSPTMQLLWQRTEANDPTVEQISMGNGKSIEVASTDDEKVIWTFGLSGCAATIVFTENEDGTRNCILTHYPPTQRSVNMLKLGDLIDASIKMSHAKTKNAVLMLPGEWEQDAETKKWELRAEDQTTVNALTFAIQAKLGTDVQITLEPYNETKDFGQKDHGTLTVYVPPSGRGDARYQTWYGGGKLTATELA